LVRSQLDHLLPDAIVVSAELDEHLGGHPVALSDEAKQQMLGVDEAVAEVVRFPMRQLQRLLRARRERNMPGGCLLAAADNLLYLLADRLQPDPQRLQRLGRDSFLLVDQAEQEMLGADVVVVQHPGFFLRQDNYTPGPIGEPLEHVSHRRS